MEDYNKIITQTRATAVTSCNIHIPPVVQLLKISEVVLSSCTDFKRNN